MPRDELAPSQSRKWKQQQDMRSWKFAFAARRPFGGCVAGRCACPPTIRARRSSYKPGASLGLRLVLPRAAGQVRAVVRFKPAFLGQIQASPAKHIRRMIIMKSFILLCSMFFRSWSYDSLLRCSARHQLFPAVQTRQGQEAPASPSPSNRDRSSGSKLIEPLPPVDSTSNVVGWLKPSPRLRSAFTTN